MTKSTIPRLAAATAVLLLTGPALAQGGSGKDPAAMSAQDVRACMGRNLVARGALRDLSLDVFDLEGKIRSLRMRLFWKPSKTGGTRVNLRLLEPAAMAGSSYLLVQEGATEEVYFYLPGADRSLRITGQNMSEPLWGTDFSYGEIKQVLGLLWAGATTRGADTKVFERPAYVLETATKAEETGYRKVVNAVDQTACVLLKTDFHVKADQPPRKSLTADVGTLIQADQYWTVLGYTMGDLQRKTRTVLTLTDLSFNESLSEKMFQPKTFFSERAPQ